MKSVKLKLKDKDVELNISRILPTAVQLVLFIVALVSFIRKPLPFKAKWPWLPLLFVNIIGPIIYLAFGSRSLDKKILKLSE